MDVGKDISLADAIKMINDGAPVLVTNDDETRAIYFNPGTLKARLTVKAVELDPIYSDLPDDDGKVIYTIE